MGGRSRRAVTRLVRLKQCALTSSSACINLFWPLPGDRRHRTAQPQRTAHAGRMGAVDERDGFGIRYRKAISLQLVRSRRCGRHPAAPEQPRADLPCPACRQCRPDTLRGTRPAEPVAHRAGHRSAGRHGLGKRAKAVLLPPIAGLGNNAAGLLSTPGSVPDELVNSIRRPAGNTKRRLEDGAADRNRATRATKLAPAATGSDVRRSRVSGGGHRHGFELQSGQRPSE